MRRSGETELRRAVRALEARSVRELPEAEPTLEEFFVSPDYFDVGTATAVQRAVCRIADGLPLGPLAEEPLVRASLDSWTDRTRPWDGTSPPRPRELVLVGATRSGKTRFSAAQAVHLARTANLDGLKSGEVPCVPIVSLTTRLAQEAFAQLRGTVLARPALRRWLVEEPLATSLLLRHPSGTPVRIEVTAGKRAGSSLIARWLVGVVFDEAPRMTGSADGAVVSLDDSLAAIQSRVRPGGQVLLIGSPWAPSGTVHARVIEHHGAPTDRICVVRAKAQWLNPIYWTDDRVEALRRSALASDQLSYRTDCEADFADAEHGLITAGELAAVTRDTLDLPAETHVTYAAAIDPAARLNAWTLVVKKRAAGKDVVVLCRQWQRKAETGALDPDQVLGEMAKILAPYRVRHVATDKWQVDTLTALARRHGLILLEFDWSAHELTEVYLDLQAKIARGLVELPPDPDLRADLLGARRRVTSSGMVIDLAATSDGRHGDYVPALARCLRQHVPDAAPAPLPKPDPERRMLEAAVARYAPRPSRGSRQRVIQRWDVR
ncbi:MAG TPA: hypothetical protein VMI75_10305 [Polyangiaceae bacterium]|nr:hypothetical protein [Polyangiaceae bacterium]